MSDRGFTVYNKSNMPQSFAVRDENEIRIAALEDALDSLRKVVRLMLQANAQGADIDRVVDNDGVVIMDFSE